MNRSCRAIQQRHDSSEKDMTVPDLDKQARQMLKTAKLYCTRGRVAILKVLIEAAKPLSQDQIARLSAEDRFDKRTETLFRSGTLVSLPPRVLRLLGCLLERPGDLLTKDELVEAVWDGYQVMDHSLTEAVQVLRRTLEDDSKDPIYIQTVWGVGYKFEP